MRTVTMIALSVCLAAGCGNRHNKAVQAEAESSLAAGGRTVTSAPSAFEAQATDAVEHSWEGYDFGAGFLGGDTVKTEEIFGRYVYFLIHAPEAASRESVKATLSKAEANEGFYKWLIGQVSHYLYDPNSPGRNEEVYAAALEQILASPLLDKYWRMPYESDLRRVNRNRRGTLATDFAIDLDGGQRLNLHDIRSQYTLLYFYNPDCGDCQRVQKLLENSAAVRGLLSSGRLTVMAVYPDTDLGAWEKHLPEISPEWINGHTASKQTKEGDYDLRAIPSLYLLDRDKRVLLKDAIAEQVESYLININDN